jgi:hypothetical protein
MNKYLFEKIEQARGAYFENLIFLSSEVCRNRISNTFEEFTELDPKEIAEVLGWNKKEETLKLITDHIEEKELSSLLLQYDMTGFLAECHMPEHYDFRFNEGEDEPWCCSVHGGILTTFWLYAESIGELVHKLEEKTEELYIEAYTQQKNKK